MKQKTIIAVSGTANIGKSMTISSLGRQIVAAGGTAPDDVTTKDYRAVIKYLSKIIGVQTYGDTEDLVQSGLDALLNHNCDIIVIASKGYGATVDAIGAFAGTNGYRLIWTSPYEVRDGSIPTTTIKDYGASHLLLMINDIISGSL